MPLALVPRNTLDLCPGSRHLPAPCLEVMRRIWTSVAHLKLAPSKCPFSANRRDVTVELRKPLALATYYTCHICPGSRHLPAPCLEAMGWRGVDRPP